jgi:hypothetical protein
MCEQAGASTEILNELILNKEQVGLGGGQAWPVVRGGSKAVGHLCVGDFDWW